MLVVIAHYRARPGTGESVEAALQRHAVASSAEPGCLQFIAHRSIEESERFALYEAYVDESAFMAHRATAHFANNIEATVLPLLVERTWSRYEIVGPSPADADAGPA
jgi:quinol monooxygenase YgiN